MYIYCHSWRSSSSSSSSTSRRKNERKNPSFIFMSIIKKPNDFHCELFLYIYFIYIYFAFVVFLEFKTSYYCSSLSSLSIRILSYAIMLLEGMMKGRKARKWKLFIKSSSYKFMDHHNQNNKKKSEKRHKILHELCFHQRENTLEGCFADSFTF